MNGELQTSSPETPDTGEECQKGALSSVQRSIQSLDCETAQSVEQGDWLTSNQKNQTHQPQGQKKEKEPNLET